MSRMNQSLAFAFLIGMAAMAWGRIPPPPVNQNIGIPDTVFNLLNAAVCNNCHGGNPPVGVPVDPTYNPDRHHLSVGQPIDGDPEDPPVPDANGDGIPDTVFSCLNCHRIVLDPSTGTSQLDPSFRDCLTCHRTTGQTTVHHATPTAQNGNCFQCHGSIVQGINVVTLTGKRPDPNNPGQTIPVDIPTYRTSLVTPWRSNKPNADFSIVSSAGTSPGNCTFCHNTVDGSPNGTPEPFKLTDGSTVMINIFRNMDNHHGTGFFGEGKCTWCHDVFVPSAQSIRVCERCHDRLTLHNIEFDAVGDGTQPGREQPYFGHIGNADNCWGCHGNNSQIMSMSWVTVASATIPTLSTVNKQSIEKGSATQLKITGNGFINSVEINGQTTTYRAQVQLTDRAGKVTVLTPSLLTTNNLEVTVPPTLAAGSYDIQIKKNFQLSNPLGFAITKPLKSTTAYVFSPYAGFNIVVVEGEGFSERLAAAGSGTTVTDEYGVQASQVYYWTDQYVIAQFRNVPTRVTVKNVFGSVTAPLARY